MSEQRETYSPDVWLPWSNSLGAYEVEDLCSQGRDYITEECDQLRASGWRGATDWAPVRIPPPAEIEANARDAATLRWIRDWLDDRQRDEDYESFTSDFLEDLVGQIERASRQYAAMEGGE